MKTRFTIVDKRASSNTKAQKINGLKSVHDSWKEREKAYSNVYGATLMNKEKQNLKNIGEQFYIMKDTIVGQRSALPQRKRKVSRIRSKGRPNNVEIMDVFPG